MTGRAAIRGRTRRATRPRLLAALLLAGLLPAGGMLVLATAPAQTRIEKLFDNWTVVCVEPAEGTGAGRRCTMSQKLLSQKARRPVLSWTIVPEPEKGALGVIVSAPLGVRLRPGLRLSFGKDDARDIAYTVCGPRWCQATFQLSDELRLKFAGHQTVQVSFVRGNGRRLAFDAPLAGFAEALAYLAAQTEQNTAAQRKKKKK